eukprot:TRINITY_DN10012_c0_g1_i3.p1 TRINITY_DN10012_c0_g1~~TRINITY_DN10012_c0_g1_i3.p1  ORF type:complete len:129 (+),score=22.20 TRINITY_DN10012_c0_g1_i3:730-1116(+)
MNECKTIYESYWEAIRVKRMLKRSHLGKVTPQEEKLPQMTTDHHVEEPVAEELQTETEDSTNKVRLEFPSMGNGDQKIHVAREKALIIEIPDTDFIFGADCDLMVHVLQVKHPTDRFHINTNFTHQKK